MTYKKIAAYGVVGDGSTLALIGVDGSVDWMCLPYMDSPSVFCGLLDADKGGRFSISPAAPFDSVQEYLPQTNILKTRFRTRDGTAELLDFMHVKRIDHRDANGPQLIRRIRGIEGEVPFALECGARLDYGRTAPAWNRVDSGWCLRGMDEALHLQSTATLEWKDERANARVAAGDELWLVLSYGAAESASTASLQATLAATEEYWIDWLSSAGIKKYPSGGFWQDELERSALVMKLLQMRHTGALAAAATTSLPAIIHGERNWDYRYSWIRDASMTVRALFELGHEKEVVRYFEWLKAVARDRARLAVAYQLRDYSPPPDERELQHLEGYKGSRPVRVGQYIVRQTQHDIYGELLETFFEVSRFVGKISLDEWSFLRQFVDHVTTIWRDKDDGIWEARIGPRHYTHSKLMCWVALDRGIKIAEHYGFPGELAKWRSEREALREEITERGFNRQRNAFRQHYDTDAVDAALLLIPLTGFLPIDDKRVEGTIRAIEEDLVTDGCVLRYVADDGLKGQEGGFLICLFWYLHCLIKQRRTAEVEEYLRAIDNYGNHLGLFGEQFDPSYREITGNFPQAYSHIGYVNVVMAYLDAQMPRHAVNSLSLSDKISLVFRARLLNRCESKTPNSSEHPGEAIRRTMNALRGHFYNGQTQRIDYPLIAHSHYYPEFRRQVCALAKFDPGELAGADERIAFWINVYNTLIIHGVVELGITESVHEAPFFFRRIEYEIGGCRYTPDDIEHGILRGNRRPRRRLQRQFASSDPRLHFAVAHPDPRIHFALVCASRTCPPIEAYSAHDLDHQLTTSAQVFISATTTLDERTETLHVSEIFKWYEEDFGHRRPADIARYIAAYVFDDELAERLRRDAERIEVEFDPYDWRLNR
jgi:GH15 family glucan-1,4-alpha-glucosidase